MPPTIYNINNATIKHKMAAFDYDWTMVCPKDMKTFPTSVDDWQWLYPSVPEKIRSFHNDGYMIVIFTNQSKAWKHDQVQLVAKTLNIPVFIVIATEKNEYKPNPVSFTSLVGYDEKTIDKDASFFVGDALGRKGDFADTDKLFAEATGIRWISPESMFGGEPASFKVDIAFPLSKDPEIIIMVGYPGSGKSTIARKICEDNSKYIHIESDVLKTSAKMIKNAAAHVADKKSIIFDATNSSVKKRKEYIEFAKKHGYNVTCVHVETSKEESYKRNKTREEAKQVPKIAYSVYSKHFEQPKEEEGFRLYEA